MAFESFEIDSVAYIVIDTFEFQQRQRDISLTAIIAQELLIFMSFNLFFDRL
jgi:hypothetical protein